MVVLVRCFDDTFALALQSRLHSLKNEGLICAYLKNGTWIEVTPGKRERAAVPPKRRSRAAVTPSRCAHF